MADVQIVPLRSFVHGRYRLRAQQAMLLPESIAQDLERAGLVRFRPTLNPKALAGKGSDDGPGQPSSASQAAQASTIQTSRPSRRGVSRTPPGDASA
jgi:hypothetical protein